jgi:hypothetical protein
VAAELVLTLICRQTLEKVEFPRSQLAVEARRYHFVSVALVSDACWSVNQVPLAAGYIGPRDMHLGLHPAVAKVNHDDV